MSSDSEMIQTPLMSRRVVKMEPHARSKSLNIAKILGKMKNSANYSGYSTNSSFNKDNMSIDFLKIDDDLFPEDKEEEAFIEQKIKEKRKEITEKARSSPKRTKGPIEPLEEPNIAVENLSKKRGRPRKTDTDTKKLEPKKPKTKPTTAKKTLAKKPKPEKKLVKRKKQKKKDDEPSLFSLFEVLDVGEEKDSEKEIDEVFILQSPVKKKRKTRHPKKITMSITKKPKLDLASDPFDDHFYDAFSSDDGQKARDGNLCKEEDSQQQILHQSETDEIKMKKLRDGEKELEKLKLEQEIKAKKEQLVKAQLKKEKRQERLKMLEKFKESVSQVIGNDETVMVPLKDEDERDVSINKVNLRRASLASRGKRLSSIGNGFIGTPHAEIPENELHKHLDIDLPDSFKLRNLLIWIGKRLIENENDKWIHDVLDKFENDDEITDHLQNLTKTVLNQLLEDLSHGKVKVDWWGDQSNSMLLNFTDKPIVVKKNKENVENSKNLEFYLSEIKKLQRETNIWNSIGEHDHISETEKFITKFTQLEIPKHEFISEKDKRTEFLVKTAYIRAGKLNRLVRRLKSTNELIERVVSKRTKKIVENLTKESECDALGLLKKLQKLQ